MSQNIGSSIELFYGRATVAEARVYAQVKRPVAESELRLSGSLLGPECRYAQTLPATIPLKDLGAGPTLLAEAVLPGPCSWTPEMPFLYRATVKVQREGQLLVCEERLLGIRRLGVRRKDFVFEGKRWVLRGVAAHDSATVDVAACRDIGTAVILRDPTDDLCEELSLAGVLAVAEVTAPQENIHEELMRLARWPAVGIALITCAGSVTVDMKTAPRNLLLAQRLNTKTAPAQWAQLLFCSANDKSVVAYHVIHNSMPVIAERPAAGGTVSIREGRQQCDQLQADLAGEADTAGYVIIL